MVKDADATSSRTQHRGCARRCRRRRRCACARPGPALRTRRARCSDRRRCARLSPRHFAHLSARECSRLSASRAGYGAAPRARTHRAVGAGARDLERLQGVAAARVDVGHPRRRRCTGRSRTPCRQDVESASGRVVIGGQILEAGELHRRRRHGRGTRGHLRDRSLRSRACRGRFEDEQVVSPRLRPGPGADCRRGVRPGDEGQRPKNAPKRQQVQLSIRTRRRDVRICIGDRTPPRIPVRVADSRCRDVCRDLSPARQRALSE
jgi:hypothetical protein